jgi:signal transduction histidine kinase
MFHPEPQRLVEGGFWDIAYFAMFSPFFISGFILLFDAISRSDSDEERSRLRYILAAAIIGVVTASADHAQALGFPVPRLGPFGSVLYPSILAIGLFRHLPAFDVLAQTRLRLEILNEMAAGLAHEVRNPLSSIKGAARLLSGRLKAPDEPGCLEYLDVITEEVERLDGILENFQHFTRPLKVEKAPVSISEAVRKTVRLVEADTHDMKIDLEIAEDMGMVRADASLMKQVFLNIIKNAAEACGSGGELTIRVGHASAWAKISFADNGTGIPRETMGRLFEPFFTTKTAGMGMGLSVSQRIVQAHDGRIEVRNISPQGAEFSILLPL